MNDAAAFPAARQQVIRYMIVNEEVVFESLAFPDYSPTRRPSTATTT
jgi:hypothetical protein